MKFSVFAPATIGNIGSGFDVLGLAVDGLGDTFHFASSSSYSIQATGRDAIDLPLDPKQNAITIAASAYYQLVGLEEQPFSVHVERALPMAGGLGSSAASSVAGALAAARLVNADTNDKLVLKAALAGEAAVAGPHLDNIAPCFFGGLTLVQDTETLAVYSIPLQSSLWIVLITPPIKIKTRDARQVLPTQLTTAQWTRQMAHCTTLALALARGDYHHLAYGLTDTFAEPARGPLIPGFEQAKSQALAQGAFGFSLSGSGPTCFAMCPDRTTAEKVGRALSGVFGAAAQMNIVQPRIKGAEITS